MQTLMFPNPTPNPSLIVAQWRSINFPAEEEIFQRREVEEGGADSSMRSTAESSSAWNSEGLSCMIELKKSAPAIVLVTSDTVST